MNFPIDYLYRLVDRGGAGLSCDAQGVALGSAELARLHLEEGCVRRCEVRSPEGLGQILKTAYGPQPDAVVQRLHRGLRRTAAWLESGDLCQAGVEAVMLRVPDLNSTGVAKLAALADLEKRNASWEDQPRLPAGQADGGQWTTGGGGSATASAPTPVSPPLSNPASVQLTPPPKRAEPKPTLDDGVYRPGQDDPRFTLIGEPQEEPYEEPSYRSNGPPEDVSTLQEMFPGLKEHPLATAVMAPLDHFIGFSSMADQVGRLAQARIYQSLLNEIKAIDPKYNDFAYFPPGGFAGLPQADRNRIVDSTLMDRASAYYRVRGDARPLQIETLKFLRKTVDKAVTDAIQADHAGILTPRLSRQEAIGNFVDKVVRGQLKYLYNEHYIPYGVGKNIRINNRDYDTSSSRKNYVIPDARIADTAFDWTIRMKKGSDAQIKGFFAADSKPIGVVIIRPSQIDPNGGAYYIPRPTYIRGR